jgi:thiopeptide-type bacteriocin biosynthesis protein
MVKRKFFIGDEWLFYKIYTGPKTADLLISELIYPCVHSLLDKNLIDKWFFLRYGDPHYHIRLRIHIDNFKYLGYVINILNSKIKSSFEERLIWKIQTDTYSRELERYGNKTIELTEELFYYDSEMIANFLSLSESANIEFYRWLFSVKAIDQLLNDFNYELSEKYKLLFFLKQSFGEEFEMNKSLKLQLDKKFRKERPHINRLMNGDEEFKPIYDLVRVKSGKIKSITNKILLLDGKNELERPLDDFMGSYIHMLCNRLFKSKQRLHELVIYDFMSRYYKSEIAKAKHQKKEKEKKEASA